MLGFLTICKMNLKLLLRNKGYLVALIILPIFSVIMLDINNIETMYDQENGSEIHEMSSDTKGMINMTNSMLSIKVYDSSDSKLADYILKELSGTRTYSINRYRILGFDRKTIKEKAVYSANHNVIGAVIYIPDNFEQQILSGKDGGLIIYKAAKDARVDLLESHINTYLKSIYQYAAIANYDKEEIYGLLDKSLQNEVTRETVSIEVGNALNLTAKQKGQSSNIGYSLAFLTVSFLFSGVFIASTIIEERQNRVYNRFVLSESSLLNYGLAKLMMVIITVIMETAITAIAITVFVRTDFGIPFSSYLFMVFCTGLIFNLLSVVIGILTNNVLTSNYIAFTIWCFSCMFSGLYFPLDAASSIWARASLLMPQRWVIKSSEMLMAGKSGVYGMFLLVFFSYLILTGCVGLLGTKLRRRE